MLAGTWQRGQLEKIVPPPQKKKDHIDHNVTTASADWFGEQHPLPGCSEQFRCACMFGICIDVGHQHLLFMGSFSA